MGKESKTGVAHIYASYNDIIIHVTDMTGAETLAVCSGGQVVRADRLESSPTAATLAAKEVALKLKDKNISRLHVKIRAPGGHNGPWYPGPGAQPAIKALTRAGIKVLSVEDITKVAHGGCRKKGGRRGRRQ